MTEEEVIEALEQYRHQRAAKEMQNMVAQAMFGASAPAAAPGGKPSMLEILQQVEQAEQRALNFQDPNDQESQTVLGLLLDL